MTSGPSPVQKTDDGRRLAFAVVGHPNKGKSSIVSTLAQDDSVLISPRAGSTVAVEEHVISVTRHDFTLYDTPGFQRPQKVYNWLQEKAEGAHRRAQAVERFLKDKECQRRFPEETELLRPIAGGAAVLYVVDGSHPYSFEYEAEMEILRWTGEASMALINPVENEKYVDEWENALKQYFNTVRVFNPMEADLKKKKQIFEAFCHIKPEYADRLKDLNYALDLQHNRRRERTLNMLTEMLVDLRTCKVSEKTKDEAEADRLTPDLEKRYIMEIEEIEKAAHDHLLSIYNYRNLDYSIHDMTVRHILPYKKGVVLKRIIDPLRKLFKDRLHIPIEVQIGLTQGPECREFIRQILHRYLSLFSALQRRTHARRDQLIIQDKMELVAGDFNLLVSKLNPRQQEALNRNINRLCRQRTLPRFRDSLRPLLNLLSSADVQFADKPLLTQDSSSADTS